MIRCEEGKNGKVTMCDLSLGMNTFFWLLRKGFVHPIYIINSYSKNNKVFNVKHLKDRLSVPSITSRT